METFYFDKNFEVLQDVHGAAERYGITKPDFNPAYIGIAHNISAFEPIERLDQLQTVFEAQPNFGRNLRFYNSAPWWYRLKFVLPDNAPAHTVVRVGAADYYADVYLNGVKLGSHEGYFKSFEFKADHAIRRGGEENILLIKVSSPWDAEIIDGGHRCGGIIRNMIKGTYEHADPFGSRDLNPIGLWKPVEIVCYDNNRISDVFVRTDYENGTGRLIAEVSTDYAGADIRMKLINKHSGRTVYTTDRDGSFDESISGIDPWTSYERGTPGLYSAVFELIEDGETVQRVTKTVGFRKIELRRTEHKTEYYLNGEKIFIRGTSYLPDFYVSRLIPQRIKRDINDMISVGINMIRVHVHTQIPEFYEMCDEAGMLVMQDNDLNWTFNNDESFLPNIMDVWKQLIEYCAYHPCVCTLVCINEPVKDEYITLRPAPQMEEYAKNRIPNMPIIRGSGKTQDLHSGDSHNYTGSLYIHVPETYLDNMIRDTEKLNTEFGMDCPAQLKNLAAIPQLYHMLDMSEEKHRELSEYQYRLLKYYIENYRIRKYSPCAGYIQFLFTDPVPQSFFGVIDFFGTPKRGIEALKESNGLFCAILEHDTASKALWAVNDSLTQVNAVLKAELTDKNGNDCFTQEYNIALLPDSSVRVCDFTEVKTGDSLFLTLYDETGKMLSSNRYFDPLTHPSHPKGHPHYINSKYCMHFYRDMSGT